MPAETLSRIQPKLLPSYVGSKSRWLPDLGFLGGRHIVEPFAGSSAISMALAGSATLNDADPFVATVLSRFDEQEVPEAFTADDFYAVRGREDWWRWGFCLSAMAFSGVWRHGPNGFNVSAKSNVVHVRPQYEAALARWQALKPLATCGDYRDVEWRSKSVMVVDPPYSGSHASYARGFDHDALMGWIDEIRCDVVLFNTVGNLHVPIWKTRDQRVVGHRSASVEACSVRRSGHWLGTTTKPAKSRHNQQALFRSARKSVPSRMLNHVSA